MYTSGSQRIKEVCWYKNVNWECGHFFLKIQYFILTISNNIHMIYASLQVNSVNIMVSHESMLSILFSWRRKPLLEDKFIIITDIPWMLQMKKQWRTRPKDYRQHFACTICCRQECFHLNALLPASSLHANPCERQNRNKLPEAYGLSWAVLSYQKHMDGPNSAHQ